MIQRSLVTRIVQQQCAVLRRTTKTSTSKYGTGKIESKATTEAHNKRSFCSSSSSSSQVTHKPLLLWIVDGPSVEGQVYRNLHLLLGSPQDDDSSVPVASVEDVVSAVNARYDGDASQQFVGGMGESDPGVWFLRTAPGDALDHADFIQNSVATVKEERHGVPFGVHTTGILQTMPPNLAELGIDTFRVSLFAGNPVDYEKATERPKKDFGTVCGFIANAAEQGVAVEAAVKKEYAAQGARDLALSLGAQDVLVYD